MAIKKPDAYLWKPGAILNSPRVEDLSPLEELWYRRALDRSFDDEGISADPVKAATRIGRKCTPAAAEKILKIFFVPKPRDPSKMVNPRQEIERKNAVKALKRFSDAGKASGRKRREKKQLSAEQRLNDVATINKQINKDKKEEEIREETPQAASPPKRGSRIPDVFLLTAEMTTWAKEKRPDVDPALETEKFCNHFRSATGRTATKLNWRLTWNNWILNARGNNGTNRNNNTNGHRATSVDRLRATAEIVGEYPTEAELRRKP